MAVLRKHNPLTGQWDILQGGVQGLQGPPVALGKGTVTTTAAGTNADFSITGTPPAQVLHLTLPRGEAGGFTTSAFAAAGTDLSTLTTPGLYYIDPNAANTLALGYPTGGWGGHIEVVRYNNTNTLMQRATSIALIANSALAHANGVVVRSRYNGTWGLWRQSPLVGDLSLDIVGAGRPDVAGTMTTEVAALVATATSGAKFRSTDGPQGAWEWQKRGTTWVVTAGDTGQRLITTGFPTNVTGRLILNRQNGMVTVLANLMASVAGDYPITSPSGFGWALSRVIDYEVLASTHARSAANTGRVYTQTNSQTMMVQLGLDATHGNTFFFTRPAIGNWPTTLPGTAA